MINRLLNNLGPVLDQLINLVPTPGKLTIIPVSQYAPVPVPSGTPFTAMFNPDQWTDREAFVYRDPQPGGTKGSEQRFNSVRPRDLSFEILIDGTGASGEKKDVAEELKALYATVGFNGNVHRPNKLFIIWGKFIFQGVIETLDITYTLFKPSGEALRAKVRLKFKHDTDNVTRTLDMNLHSADLTHVRSVHAGDRLDQLSHAIYESPRFVLALAQANDLTSFRSIEEGSVVTFPPIEK